ncbi:MAG TPA: hypothetical protein PLC61_00200 [Chitinophagales bacterium]|nr:hypothetical protein [Chitinophagales bacterium]MCB0512218.1 hypothetical protein [Bacteroidota bacterium]HMU98117.1 hypothetical protein [Chitinophagales bacterium]HMV02990.1 hypothetical protein [Chitinophagales bacterium]HMW94545.1 hypothetical protein [Chitinophagales bacterium]
MGTISVIFGVLSVLGMLLGFIPFLGWFNWLNIPFAVVGLILALVSNSRNGKILNIVAIIIGVIRLFLGGGII